MNQNQDNNSNRDAADANGHDETFVQQALASLGQPESIDPQFVDRLSHRLDAEFATVVAGQADSPENGIFAQRPSNDPSDIVTRNGSKNGTRIFPRWLGGLIAAAVLMGVFSFWTAQPLTSWAEMIKALKSTSWVQTDSGRTSSWFSDSNQIVARRDANQTVFMSGNAGTHFNYVREDAQIYQTNAAETWLPLESDLMAWLARSSQSSNDPDANWNVISETATSIDDQTGRWLKLTVVFESTKPTSQKFTAIFTLNPETKLPVSCQVHQGMMASGIASAGNWKLVSFDYPTEGPADIFDLGVAASTPIILAESDGGIGLIAGTPVKPVLPVEQFTKVVPPPAIVPPPAKKDPVKPAVVEPETPKVASLEPNKTSPPAEAKEYPAAAKESASLEPKAAAIPSTIPIVPIPRTSTAMTARIDELIDQLWTEQDVLPVDQATDEAFLRRVYLDVIGRVPTISEYDQFFELDTQSRRNQLIDQLLESREHALHLGGIWKRVLVPDDETAISRLGGSGKLEQWLSDSFAKNQPYDELVRELLLAEGRVNESGPLLFYAAAKMNAEELAARTSRSFLGMRMECAECHDHPFDHWSQEDFWSLAAYFAQISRPQGKIEMVSPVLRVRDANFGEVKLPETETVIKPRLPLVQHGDHGMTASDIASLENAEVTGGSRREQLAAWITHPQNSHFSQATANRIWAHLFGRGLVDPVDDMGGHNQALSPQLLNQLGRYFVQSDFDVRKLMKVILNSRAYQLSSQNSDEKASKQVNLFARMSLKPLTAEQLYDCLATATGRSNLGRQVPSPMVLSITANVDRFSDPGRAAFLAQFRTSIDQRTDYQAGIPQALTLMNGPMIASATTDAPKGILRSLSAPFFDDETRVEKLFVATLSRKPSDEERKWYADFLDSQPAAADKSETLGDVLWVLLNSTEFTMNH